MQRTYCEVNPDVPLSRSQEAVAQFFSDQTPLWFVELEGSSTVDASPTRATTQRLANATASDSAAIACLWMGNAVDQVRGDRHAHIFLIYVDPAHRRRGIGSALVAQAEGWATARGDRQIGLQVFQSNQAALSLYTQLGFEARSLWLAKPLV
jgi:ribosomal protein S18 acetylase RimI-like enzyme